MGNKEIKTNSKHMHMTNSTKGYFALLCAILCLSIGPILIRTSEAPGIVSSFYRMSIAFVFLIIFTGKSEKKEIVERFKNPASAKWFILLPILAGICSGIDHSLWATAVKATTIANATILNSIAPIWVSILAFLFLKEKFKPIFWLGLILTITGVFFVSGISITNLIQSFSIGDFLAILSSVFYSGYFILTQVGRKNFSAVPQMLISLAFSATTIGIIIFFCRYSIIAYNLNTFISFLIIAVISQLCGYYCVTYALGNLPASVVSPGLELFPVTSAFLAYFFLNESMSIPQLFGSAIVLIGTLIISFSKKDEPQTN